MFFIPSVCVCVLVWLSVCFVSGVFYSCLCSYVVCVLCVFMFVCFVSGVFFSCLCSYVVCVLCVFMFVCFVCVHVCACIYNMHAYICMFIFLLPKVHSWSSWVLRCYKHAVDDAA